MWTTFGCHRCGTPACWHALPLTHSNRRRAEEGKERSGWGVKDLRCLRLIKTRSQSSSNDGGTDPESVDDPTICPFFFFFFFNSSQPRQPFENLTFWIILASDRERRLEREKSKNRNRIPRAFCDYQSKICIQLSSRRRGCDDANWMTWRNRKWYSKDGAHDSRSSSKISVALE